jgi:hypothetical protein
LGENIDRRAPVRATGFHEHSSAFNLRQSVTQATTSQLVDGISWLGMAAGLSARHDFGGGAASETTAWVMSPATPHRWRCRQTADRHGATTR